MHHAPSPGNRPGRATLTLKSLPGALMLSLVLLLACAPVRSRPKGEISAVPADLATTPTAVSISPTAPTDSPPLPAEGTILPGRLESPVLQEDMHYYAYLPAGYEEGQARYPVVYLLHGRGENMADWAKVKQDLDRMIAAGEVPQLIAILPDAPWSHRASYYVDSQYTGPQSPGRAVETAFVNDLIPHVDATYRTIAERDGRAIAGYSMGGYGALRYALAHADLFMGAIVLSPAVYVPLPPAESSTREFGAFGSGDVLFDESIWVAKNYTNSVATFLETGLESRLFIAVGDDEYKHPDPADHLHDLDLEAHRVFNTVSRVKGLSSELRVLDGGHGWEVWRPGLVEGLQYLSRALAGPRVPGPAEAAGQGD